jgi:vesicle transport protein SEC22
MSSRLTSDTRIYAEKAKDLNRQVRTCRLRSPFQHMHLNIFGYLVSPSQHMFVLIVFQALIRKYAPVAIVIGIVLMLFWVKNKIW